MSSSEMHARNEFHTELIKVIMIFMAHQAADTSQILGSSLSAAILLALAEEDEHRGGEKTRGGKPDARRE